MIKQSLKYILLCMGFYLLLAAIEVFAFKPLISLATTKFVAYVIIYNVIFIIIDPILVKLIVDKLFNITIKNEKTSA